ncbi:hypothetical protein CLV97_101128 [Planifilum fimeticola]|jgi:hypothetical protein|uniref:Uncharacterized protein n=1 Tax=Planifilum fimeticola TaxID=201975 RepID=A0A2T0LJD2_9BACL|nr:hypothetical protein [Planifilum fimeticola]PRX42639.1 hypothetical protein CLV97_101128 [Planifilum fimeticola]
MKTVWTFGFRLFCLNVLIALVLGLLVAVVALIMPGKPLVVYSVVGLFFFVYLFGWFYYAKWVYERQTEDVLIQSSLIGFSPNLVFGIVGLVYAVLVALLAGKPSTIFVYSLLSIASIMLAVAGLVAILLYKKQLDRKHTENFH